MFSNFRFWFQLLKIVKDTLGFAANWFKFKKQNP